MNISARNKKGYVLTWLMTAVVLVAICSSTLYMSIYMNNLIFINDQNVKAAYYSAVAGAEYALFLIKNSPTYNPLDRTTWPVTASQEMPFYPFGQPDGSLVVLSISQPGGPGTNYTIVSNGAARGKTKILTITASSKGAIKSWQ